MLLRKGWTRSMVLRAFCGGLTIKEIARVAIYEDPGDPCGHVWRSRQRVLDIIRQERTRKRREVKAGG